MWTCATESDPYTDEKGKHIIIKKIPYKIKKMEVNKTSAYVNKFLFGLLTIAFVILKLTKVISWSWWWVLAPIWIPFAIGLIVLIISIFFTSKKFK